MKNLGDNSFAEISEQCGEFFKRRQVARGAAFGDFDNDGDLDVLIGCNNQPAILLRNDTKTQNRSVRLQLVGNGCNRDALGACVSVTAGLMTQRQFVRSGTSYLSDHDRRLVFGIGAATGAEVTIQWPCGATEELHAKAADLIIVEQKHCLISGMASEINSVDDP